MPKSKITQSIERARELLTPKKAADGHYPIDALGPLAAAARAIADGIQCSPALAGQSVLAAAALLAQGVANVRGADGRAKPLSLYALSIAKSGDGKDSADSIAFHAIREWQRSATKTYRQVLAQLGKDDTPPPEPYRVTKDITAEGLRLAFEKGVSSQGIFSTEAATMLVGHAMTFENRGKTAAALCSLWDGAGLSVARAGSGRFEKFGPRLSIHLMVQPAAVSEVMADTALHGIGFWARFLLAWPDPLQPRKYRPFHAESSRAIVAYWRRCEELLHMPLQDDNDKLSVLECSHDAAKVLGEFFEECEQRARLGNWQPIETFGLRGAELAARIAGVQTVFSGSDVVDAETVARAIRLVRHSMRSWQAALESGHVDPVATDAVTLYQWLLTHGRPIKPGDILRVGPGALRSKSRRDAALDRLAEVKLVAVQNGMVIVRSPNDGAANPANDAKCRAATGGSSDANGCERCETEGDVRTRRIP
ncbi:MAG: DUF3987 domain-containing protein [Chloroflexota bacterium]|jgi:hypothetical protein